MGEGEKRREVMKQEKPRRDENEVKRYEKRQGESIKATTIMLRDEPREETVEKLKLYDKLDDKISE